MANIAACFSVAVIVWWSGLREPQTAKVIPLGSDGDSNISSWCSRGSCPTTNDAASSSVMCKGDVVVAKGEGCSYIASHASIRELTY